MIATAAPENLASHHVLRKAGLREQVMIDCSHANAAKQPRRQIDVAADVAARVAAGERRILGVMIESNLVAGSQSLEAGRQLTPGQSITDGCLSLGQTVPVLEQLAQPLPCK